MNNRRFAPDDTAHRGKAIQGRGEGAKQRTRHQRIERCGRNPEEYSLQQKVLWWSFVKWAVCIITTNAALRNTHPIRRQHRIECMQKIRRLRVVVRRLRDLWIYVLLRTLPSPLKYSQ